MTMAIEVTGAVAGLAITTASRTKRGVGGGGIGRTSRGIVAGGAGIMNFIVGRIHRHTGGRALDQDVGVTGDTIGVVVDPGQVVGHHMVDKVGAMTGVTVTATNWHGRGLGSRRNKRTVGVVAGATGVMDLVISRINRNAGGCAHDAGGRMAGIAVCRVRDPGQVARHHMAGEVGAMTRLARSAASWP